MPKRDKLKSILIIGSGPIIIGQACEFDYSGSQALRSLKEDGIETILINSNPATIMTDPVMADHVLNLCIEADEKGIWKKHNVEIIGVDINAINITEDREQFRNLMLEIGIPMAPQATATSYLKGKEIAQEFGFPLCVRASFTLGGAGASIVYKEEDFDELLTRGLEISPIHEVMIDKALIGWKEYELELLRDSNDNVVIICSIENMDPMGIHTGQ